MRALTASSATWRRALLLTLRHQHTRPISPLGRTLLRHSSSKSNASAPTRPSLPQGVFKNAHTQAPPSQPSPGSTSRPKWNSKIIGVLMGKYRRKWTHDDIVAMFSWLFVGQTLFILVGTTTFGMLVITAANSLQFQELVAGLVGKSISSSLDDSTVTFESAIVPNWKSRRIRLKEVRIASRDPPNPDKNKNIYDNTTRYDVKISSIEVTLSLMRWFDGKGIIKDAIINGIRGEIDRTSMDPWGETPPRSTPAMGDVNLDSLVIDDAMVTLHFPQFHPYNVSIFHGEYPRLRKQWFLHDFMLGDSVTGMYDNCLFSVYKRQEQDHEGDSDAKGRMRKLTMEVHNVPIEHVNSGAAGPFGWITQGTLDIVTQFEVPEKPEDRPKPVRRLVHTVKTELHDAVNDTLDHLDDVVHLGSHLRVEKVRDILLENEPGDQGEQTPTDDVVVCHVDARLNNLRASVPINTPHLSYISGALVQPLVAYVNANPAPIPIKFSLDVPVADFYGAYSVYQMGIPALLAELAGKSMVNLYRDDRRRTRELKRIGLWSLQTLTKNILNLVDYSRRSAFSWASDVVTGQEARAAVA